MLSVKGLTSATRARLLLYAIAFPGAIALDPITPLAAADWLIEIILVWVASVWGGSRETMLVALTASVGVVAGLWSSPVVHTPFWLGALNRIAAISIIWVIADETRRRRAAERGHRNATEKIKILERLIPICSCCKAVRLPGGEWQKLENYLSSHAEMRLTHSLCPPCADKYMEDLDAFSPRP